jgi:uncharacterized membrane protein
MNRRLRWLFRETGHWVVEGIVTDQQARLIRQRYEGAPGHPSWGILLFAGFGAVVAGLGVTLLFAYNWERMHRLAKLAVVLGALVLAHAAALGLGRRGREGFAQAAHLLGTMLYGAGIWLVAQIYHISAHYPNAFFAWAAGALLAAWTLPSAMQGLLASVVLTVWAGTEAFGFADPTVTAPLLILAGVGWLAWRLRSPVLLFAAAATFVVTVLFGLSSLWEHILPTLLAFGVLLAALGVLLEEREDFPAAGGVLTFLGQVVHYPVLFLLTFPDAVERLLEHRASRYWRGDPLQSWILHGLVVAAALAALLAASRGGLRGRGPARRLLLPAAVFAVLELAWLNASPLGPGWHRDGAWLLVVLTVTAGYAWHVLADLWEGSRQAVLPSVLRGSLLLGIWVFARYWDLFDSLLARGVMFLALGASLFTVAVLFQRARRGGAGAASLLPPGEGS